MNRTRRKFIQAFSGTSTAIALSQFYNPALVQSLWKYCNDLGPSNSATTDETFWYQVNQAYTVLPNFLNLNNGGVSPHPKVVQDAVERYNKMCNEAPSYYMWRILEKDRSVLKEKLADITGCPADTLAINRNTTEALETVIFGLRLSKGDEIVLSKQDYPNMKNAWLQRAHREGIILKWVDLKLPSEDNDYLVEQFVNQFTAKTKLVHLTHMINWNGQVLPVRRIADIAKRKGIEVLVDGAHSFCHLDFKISDLNCDYFGTSLHKWMCAPFGTGLLHVRKEKIKNLYPLFAGPNPEAETANKFENLGTRSIAIEQGIGQAINFHQMIGMERKNKRLNHLKEYWTSKAKEIPGVSFGTSLNPEYGCAITLLQIPEKDEAVLTRKLLNKYRIHTVYINHENVKGIRITPNVYTLKKDLDYFIDSLHKIVKA